MVYPTKELNAEEKKRVIHELLTKAKVPVVFAVKGQDHVEAFMEDKIYKRTIREHLPYMFEPMFILQELAIKPYYRLVQSGKNLVALERKIR